jgi:hypothetical protein
MLFNLFFLSNLAWADIDEDRISYTAYCNLDTNAFLISFEDNINLQSIDKSLIPPGLSSPIHKSGCNFKNGKQLSIVTYEGQISAGVASGETTLL